jgi:hypothetical protein
MPAGRTVAAAAMHSMRHEASQSEKYCFNIAPLL